MRKERAARWAAAVENANISGASTVPEIRSELERAAADEGLHPPAGVLQMAAELAMIGRSPRLLAGARLIWLLVRQLGGATRYLHKHGVRIRRGP